mmetsp:Transcript_26874/g.72598  ORF Transcript_26874/g.72598 Transcript_26874/m.72598 type:complete len:208 (-) Transcript_26874:78-701(-)
MMRRAGWPGTSGSCLWRRGGTTLDPYMGEADRKGGSCGFDLPCALWALVSGPARWEPVPVETAGCCCCCCSWLAERGGICRGPPEGWLWVWGEGEAVKWGVDCRGGRPICGHCEVSTARLCMGCNASPLGPVGNLKPSIGRLSASWRGCAVMNWSKCEVCCSRGTAEELGCSVLERICCSASRGSCCDGCCWCPCCWCWCCWLSWSG